MFDFDSHTPYRVTSFDTLHEALVLVYKTFTGRRYIPKEGLERLRIYEMLPNAFFICGEDKVEAVMGVAEDMTGLPGDDIFHTILSEIRGKGSVCEFTNLVAGNCFAPLTEICLDYVFYRGFDYIFITISKNHIPFFRDILGFTVMGGPELYSEETGDEVYALALEVKSLEHHSNKVDDQLEDPFLKECYLSGKYRSYIEESEKEFIKNSSEILNGMWEVSGGKFIEAEEIIRNWWLNKYKNNK